MLSVIPSCQNPLGNLHTLVLYIALRVGSLVLPQTAFALSALIFIVLKADAQYPRITRIGSYCLYLLSLEHHFTSKVLLAAFTIYAERRFQQLSSFPLRNTVKDLTWVVMCAWAREWEWGTQWEEGVYAIRVLGDWESESALLAHVYTLQSILTAIPIPLVYRRGCEVWANSAAHSILSAHFQQPKDLSSQSLFSCILNSLKPGSQKPLETTEINGELWNWSTCAGRGAEEWILVAENVTKIVRFEAEWKREAAAKAALVRSFSHEVLTPLNSIIYLSSQLPRSSDTVSLLQTNCHLLQYVLSDVIDYAEILCGKLDISKTHFNLRNCVSSLIALFSYQVNKKGISLAVSVDPLLPESIYSDERKLGQVLMNLLSNAVKYTQLGTVQVDVCLVDTGQMRVQVEDSGCGIEESALKTLFSMSNIHCNKGAGFGLSISSIIAKKLGSRRIYVHSKVNAGSKFWFEVDIVSEQSHSGKYVYSPTVYCDTRDISAIPRPLCSTIQSMDLKTLTTPLPSVLIVDDNEFNRTILRMMLETLKLKCEEARSGIAAIDCIVKRGKLTYKVVFMDIEMPEMDGLEATRQIVAKRERGELEALPVIIALTAYPSYLVKEQCMQAGMTLFLSKPISLAKLTEVVRQYCDGV